MMSGSFSVALPTYNHADFVAECVDSILNQTLQPAELVIVDDGSTDHTWDVLQQYKHVATLRRIENSGTTVARKVAAELCTASWIAFCDTDDLWAPNHLERFDQLTTRYPDVQFVFSNFEEFGALASSAPTKFDSAPDGWWDVFPPRDEDNFVLMGRELFGPLLKFTPIFPSATAVSRVLYEEVGGFNPAYAHSQSEDTDFTARCIANCTTACDFEATVSIRKHGENHSQNVCGNLQGRASILQDILDDGHVPTGLEDDVRRAIIELRLDALEVAFAREPLTEAARLRRLLPSSALTFRQRVKSALVDLRLLLTGSG